MDELAQAADVWLPWNGHLASEGGIAERSVGPKGLGDDPLHFQSSKQLAGWLLSNAHHPQLFLSRTVTPGQFSQAQPSLWCTWDTAGRLQAKWNRQRNPQEDALGFSMYRIINLRIRERTLCSDDIKHPCQDHDVPSLAADLESEICP